jgi:hypothetical protein
MARPAPELSLVAELAHLDLLGTAPRRPPRVVFYPYAEGRSTVRERDGRLEFKLSDSLAEAPSEVTRGVLSLLLCRVHGVPDRRGDPAIRAYRRFMAERPAPDGARRGRKHIEPVGRHRSLLESYLRVTLDMGVTPPTTPTLSWSQTVSFHRFGHWDADHDAIVISQILDDPGVPEFVLDYVLWHEVLHIVHPVKMGSGSKRIVHSAAFHRDERKFPRWKEGDEWIEKLARRGRRNARWG